MILFAIPVATFGKVDQGSELEVNAGAHVYPNGLEGVQSDSNPVVAHWCYSAQGSPLLSAVCVA